MAEAPSDPRRRSALIGVLVTIGLLLPGLFLPVITVRGLLQPEGMAELAPQLIDQGISNESIELIKPLLNPALLPVLELNQGGLRGAVVGPISAQVAEQLRNGQPIEIYHQTRSIVGSVRYLYEVGSATAATLILLFSVIVPVTKMLLVAWAVSLAVPSRRTLKLVEMIAKWSMADVFAVALFITYLAAQATQTAPGMPAVTIIAFDASFGPGFYWFAAYCVVSLAVQQWTAFTYREVRHL